MAAKKKAPAKKKKPAAKAPKPYTGPAVAIVEGERVESAKRGDPVVNADAATGALIDPAGSVKAQDVTG